LLNIRDDKFAGALLMRCAEVAMVKRMKWKKQGLLAVLAGAILFSAGPANAGCPPDCGQQEQPTPPKDEPPPPK
jgi:hypothetical protein